MVETDDQNVGKDHLAEALPELLEVGSVLSLLVWKRNGALTAVCQHDRMVGRRAFKLLQHATGKGSHRCAVSNTTAI